MSERDMKTLLALVQRALERGWLDMSDWLRERNSLSAIEERIARGDYANAITGLDDAARMIASQIHDNYVESGKTAAEWLDSKIDDKLIRFDQSAPTIVARAQANELELVHGFQQEQWQTTRQIVQRAMIEGAADGTNPRRVAQDFRDSIGLTPTQESHVANYRRQLETGDYTGALSRELSNGNADRSIATARAKDKALTPAQVDRFTEQYRQNYITYRAETIARTEALRNANAGASDAIQQAINRGDVEAGVLVKTWHAGPNTPYARETHQAMDGVTVKWGEDFTLPDGTRMSQPGDPRGGIENTANCRCTSSVTMA